METRTLKEKLRYDIEAATGGHGVYTFELVEEIMKAVSDYEQQVKSVDLDSVVKSWRHCEQCEKEQPHYQILHCCECHN